MGGSRSRLVGHPPLCPGPQSVAVQRCETVRVESSGGT